MSILTEVYLKIYLEYMEKIIGLKELRGRVSYFASEVQGGKSFIVVRKSKPLFKITPLEESEEWETVADFTEINKNGVSAKEVLKALRKLKA